MSREEKKEVNRKWRQRCCVCNEVHQLNTDKKNADRNIDVSLVLHTGTRDAVFFCFSCIFRFVTRAKKISTTENLENYWKISFRLCVRDFLDFLKLPIEWITECSMLFFPFTPVKSPTELISNPHTIQPWIGLTYTSLASLCMCACANVYVLVRCCSIRR